MIKVTRTFDLVKTRTSKKVAMRKNWTKFGLSKGDSKGPQDSTTIIAEEVTMRFIHADQTEEDAEEEDKLITCNSSKVSEGKSEHQVAIRCGQLEIMSCRLIFQKRIQCLIHKELLFVHWLTNMLLQETVLVQVEADSKPMS